MLRIKEKLKNKDIQTLVSNFSYLSVIEVSNYILPFITIPYIVRTIGIEKFGAIMFAYSVMTFFSIIVDYGFKLLATKYVSKNRDNIEKISKYFWTIIFTQTLLLFAGLIILILLLTNIDKFSQELWVFIFSFGIVIGNVLFPIWFFQGMERMKYIAIFNVISRIIYTILIFTIIKHESQYALIPLFSSSSYILIGIVSLYFIRKEFKVKFTSVSFKDIKLQLSEGWHLFLSSLSNSLYTSANTVLLGLLTNFHIVGVVSLATTISGAVIKIVTIFSRVTFPYISRFSDEKLKMISKARLLLRVYSVILMITAITTYLVASPLINLLFGAGKEESILLLKMLALLVFLQSYGSFFTPYLVIKNQTKVVSKITFYTMIFNFILIFPLIILFQGLGFVFTRIIVEGFQVALNISHNKELVFQKSKLHQ